MKKISSAYLYVLLGLLLTLIAGNVCLYKIQIQSDGCRRIVINRLINEINHGLDDGFSADKVLEKQRNILVREFGVNNVPSKIEYTSGGIVFIFPEYRSRMYGTLINLIVISVFIIVSVFWLFVYLYILKPFGDLAEYPEQLSKGNLSAKLPENRHRVFGKFVWGVNMLSDKLAYERKQNIKLTEDRQKLITSIAHGIKTPLFNISLYADALETGLYKEGNPDVQDKEIASKIRSNAENITTLVTDMLKSSENEVFPYTPEITSFYLQEIPEFIKKEYSNRLKVLHVPFTVYCDDNFIIQSDKNGITSILVQLMENAIKYGNGQGITLSINRFDEIIEIILRNKGQPLSESEIPFIFNSYWRGSNSGNIEGSGIGLSVSRQIAAKLGGQLVAKARQETIEMEFSVCLPICLG